MCRIEPLAASILKALSRDGQVMGGDGQKQRTELEEPFASAQLEDGISRAEDGIRTRDPHLGKGV